jgi:alkylation response protein AidB-like acyl-CoA dehydrogenase
MRFELTPEQRELRDETRDFAQNEIAPVADDLDQNHEYPEEALTALGDRNITGLTLPEKYDGRGKGFVELALVTEELSTAMMSVAAAFSLHLGVASAIERFGTTELKEEYLAKMAQFETVGVLGLSEENAGSEKAAMETRAQREGDEWVISGHKQWITNFPHADVVLLYAKTGPDEDAPQNVSAFLVPTADFEIEREWETIGANSVPPYRVEFSNLRVPDDRMVGEEGMALVQRGELKGGVNMPARAVGIARAAFEDTVEFVQDREQFGQAIGEFQGIRWRLAKMAQRVDAARLLTLRAADTADRGAATVGRDTSMAKVYATEAAVANASDAMDTHGGVGYTTEYPIERYFRDAKILTVAGGPNDTHRNTVADAVFSR